MTLKESSEEFDTLYKAIMVRLNRDRHEKLFRFGINPCNLTKEDFQLFSKDAIHEDHGSNYIYNLIIALAFQTCGTKFAEDIEAIIAPVEGESESSRQSRITNELAEATFSYIDEAKAIIQLKVPAWRCIVYAEQVLSAIEMIKQSMDEGLDSASISETMTDIVVAMLVHRDRQCRHVKDSVIMDQYVGTQEVKVCPQCVVIELKQTSALRKLKSAEPGKKTKKMKRAEKQRLKNEKALAIALSTECQFKDTHDCQSRVPVDAAQVQDPHDSKDQEVDQLLRSLRLGKCSKISIDELLQETTQDEQTPGDEDQPKEEKTPKEEPKHDEEPIKKESRKRGLGFRARKFVSTIFGK